jgi:hypothetical protein
MGVILRADSQFASGYRGGEGAGTCDRAFGWMTQEVTLTAQGRGLCTAPGAGMDVAAMDSDGGWLW